MRAAGLTGVNRRAVFEEQARATGAPFLITPRPNDSMGSRDEPRMTRRWNLSGYHIKKIWTGRFGRRLAASRCRTPSPKKETATLRQPDRRFDFRGWV